MKTATALQIASESARLAEIAARFQAKYGRHYRIDENEPQEAIALHDDSIAIQRTIAGLLDPNLLTQALERWGNWWEDMDVLSIALAAELSQEANRLISAVVYMEEQPTKPDGSYIVQYTQRAIAGMLHPEVRGRG